MVVVGQSLRWLVDMGQSCKWLAVSVGRCGLIVYTWRSHCI